MNFERLTPDNFLIYATKCYDNPQCESIEEFNEDLRRFASVKRLLLRLLRNDPKVKPRMVMNHIIILTNIFGVRPAVRMLFFYCSPETHHFLRAFCTFLNIMPKDDDLPPEITHIPSCENLLNKLETMNS